MRALYNIKLYSMYSIGAVRETLTLSTDAERSTFSLIFFSYLFFGHGSAVEVSWKCH